MPPVAVAVTAADVAVHDEPVVEQLPAVDPGNIEIPSGGVVFVGVGVGVTAGVCVTAGVDVNVCDGVIVGVEVGVIV